MAKRGLGKGLDQLLGTDASAKKNKSAADTSAKSDKSSTAKEEVGGETTLKITAIQPNSDQPRKIFDEDALYELADSIKEHGVIEPIVVIKKGRSYEIVSGERRWRAARIAGLKEIPVVIREYTNQQIVEISLIENIQRENLNPIEEAQAYQRLTQEFSLKQDELAKRVSKSRAAITNSMRLLKLCEPVQQMVIDEKLSSGHARALLGIEDADLQLDVATQVFDEELSVRETEKLIKKVQSLPKDKKTKDDIKNVFLYTDAENKLKERLGTKVSIKAKSNEKGKIEIEYYSSEELEALVDRLNTI